MHRAALDLAAGANRVELIKSTLELLRRCDIELGTCPRRHGPHARPYRGSELLRSIAYTSPLGIDHHQMLPLSSLFTLYLDLPGQHQYPKPNRPLPLALPGAPVTPARSTE
jgi:hypothetical protein